MNTVTVRVGVDVVTVDAPVNISGPVGDGLADDLNPGWDGSSGVWPISPHRPPPHATRWQDTGHVTPLAELTKSGGFTVTEPGAVVEGLDVSGTIYIDAPDVVVRDCRITTAGPNAILSLKDSTGRRPYFEVENVRARGVGSVGSSAFQYACSVRRCHITGFADGLKAYARSHIADNWIGGLYRVGGVTHNDGIQMRSGSGAVIARNTILGPYRMSTSAILVQAQAGPISVTVEDNYLSGGSFSLYTIAQGHTLTATLRNNTIEKDSWLYGARSGTANETGTVIYDPLA